MKRLGILAYGSLIANPEKEIKDTTADIIDNVITPFKVEFARSSSTRGGAPTLVPVEKGGSFVKAQVFVLKEGISEKAAMDMLWRRETHKVGSGDTYKHPTQPNENTVLVEQQEDFCEIEVVFYTKIGANIKPLTPQHLAELAIKSARSKAGLRRLDGISYLADAKRNGIKTTLMPKYEEEILKRIGANSLQEASSILRSKRLKKEEKKPDTISPKKLKKKRKIPDRTSVHMDQKSVSDLIFDRFAESIRKDDLFGGISDDLATLARRKRLSKSEIEKIIGKQVR